MNQQAGLGITAGLACSRLRTLPSHVFKECMQHAYKTDAFTCHASAQQQGLLAVVHVNLLDSECVCRRACLGAFLAR